MKVLMLVAFAVGLAGCADTIYLRNMAGMTVTCGPYYRDSIGSNSMALRETQCIQDYQRQGYQRVPE